MPINVGLLGFGTVGEGVYQTIQTHQVELSDKLGQAIQVKAILVKNKDHERSISPEVIVTDDINDILKMGNIDVVIEAIVGCEPAFTYVKKLLNRGIKVISANKEMVAHKGQQLKHIANFNQVDFAFEAAVAGGIPVIGAIKHLLHVNRIKKIEGILNGTSNYILSTMRLNNEPFSAALKLAQEEGYAEADPSNDILGTDAFYKLMILSDLVFGKQPEWLKVKQQGIEHISLEDIDIAEKKGQRIKLVASVEQDDRQSVVASVQPMFLPNDHPLYGIEGVDNAISIKTDLLGDLLLKGPGAGALPTASAILEDITLLFQKENTETISSIDIKTNYN